MYWSSHSNPRCHYTCICHTFVSFLGFAHLSKFFALSLWNAETKLQVPFHGTSSIIFGQSFTSVLCTRDDTTCGVWSRGCFGFIPGFQAPVRYRLTVNCSSPGSYSIAGLRCTSRQQSLRQLVETFQLSDPWSLIHRQWLNETQKKLSKIEHVCVSVFT